MIDGIHRFKVQCTACGNRPQQTQDRTVLRDRLKRGKEINHYCVMCDRKWPAQEETRALLAIELGLKDRR